MTSDEIVSLRVQIAHYEWTATRSGLDDNDPLFPSVMVKATRRADEVLHDLPAARIGELAAEYGIVPIKNETGQPLVIRPPTHRSATPESRLSSHATTHDPRPCKHLGRKVPGEQRNALRLDHRREWLVCNKPEFRKIGLPVTTCRTCGIAAEQRCGPGRCDGYDPDTTE